jgi:hypothetical protein
MTHEEIQAQLEAARAEATRLGAEVAEQESALEAARLRVAEATSRGAFEKGEAEVKWTTHLVELAKRRVDEHAATVSEIEARHSAAQVDRESKAVQAARKEMEAAFDDAGESIHAAVGKLAKAISSMGSFHNVCASNPKARFSRDGLKIDILLGLTRASLTEAVRKDDLVGSGASLEFINTGALGLVKLHVALPAPVPAVMK